MGSPLGEPPYGQPPDGGKLPPHGGHGLPSDGGEPPPNAGGRQPYAGQQPYGGEPPPDGRAQPPHAGSEAVDQQPWPSYGDEGPPYGPWGAKPAGRWRRLFAGVVDLVIVGLVTSPFSTTAVDRMPDGTVEAVHTGNGVIVAVVWFLYFWLLTAFWRGQTVGKKLFRLRVVQYPTQEPMTPGQAAVREAVYGIFSLACCLGLVDLAWILFDGKKQALHDKAASTIAVDA